MATTAGGWPDATIWWGAIVNATTAINYYLQHHPDYFSYVRWVTDIDATGVDYTNAASVAAAKAAYMQAYNSLTALGIAMGSYISGTNVMPLANQDRYTYSVVPKEYMPSNSVYLGTFITSYRFAIDPGDPTTVSAFHTQIAAQWAETSFLKYRFVDNSCSLQGGPYGSWADQMANVRAINLIAQSMGAKAIFNASIIMGTLSSGEMSLFLNAIAGAGVCLENPWGPTISGSASATASAVAQYRQILDQASSVVMIGYGSGTLASPAQLRAWTATWRVDTDPLYLAESFFSFPDPAIYLLSNVPPPLPPPVGGSVFAIDNTLYAAQPNEQIDNSYVERTSFCGPIEVGASLYLVLCNDQVTGGTFDILVYKSTDAGATWTVVSTATYQSSVFFQWESVGYASPRIWVLYATSPDSGVTAVLHVVSFNTSTDTWETSFTMPTPTAGTDLRIWDLTVQTDGTLTIVYSLFTGVVYQVWFIRYSGGSWGSHTQLTVTDDVAHCGLFLDPASNTTHVFYTGRNSFGIGSLRATVHRTIGSSGTVGSETQLLPAPATAYNDLYPTFGVGCIWGDKIVVPYNRLTGAGSNRTPAVFIGTPISSPVWSSTDLPFSDPDGRTNITSFAFAHCVALLDAAGNLNVFWGASVWDAEFNHRYPYLFQSVDTGTGFNTVTIPDDAYYNPTVAPTTPPATTFSTPGVFLPSASLLSSGLFGVTFQILLDTEPTLGYDVQPNLYLNGPTAPVGGGGGFVLSPFRIIVDLYGDTQLSALLPAGAPVGTLPAVAFT